MPLLGLRPLVTWRVSPGPFRWFSFVVFVFTTGQPWPILFLLLNKFLFFLSECCIWTCVLSKVFHWEFLWSTLFVRNTSIFHALFVRGFRGLLLLVDWKCINFPSQLLTPWSNLLTCFVGQV